MVCEASLGKAPPLWANGEKVGGTNVRGEKIMMVGLEQSKPPQCVGHSMKGGNRNTPLKEQGRDGSRNDRFFAGSVKDYFVFTFQVT